MVVVSIAHSLCLHTRRNRYARGEGRTGLRELQRNTRMRLIMLGRRALAQWSAFYGCSWVRLPRGHTAKMICSRGPSEVAPAVDTPPPAEQAA